MPQAFTLIDAATEAGQPQQMQATVADGRVLISDEQVRTVLGWELKPEGLCQGDVCIPVRDPDALGAADGLDLQKLAEALGRPLALDVTERAAAMAEAPAALNQSLAGGEAPDFTLPDLDGKLHSLSDHRGKKVLLIAYSSW